MDYINRINRNKTLLFPEVIEDYIDADNPVHFIDAYFDNVYLIYTCTC